MWGGLIESEALKASEKKELLRDYAKIMH